MTLTLAITTGQYFALPILGGGAVALIVASCRSSKKPAPAKARGRRRG